MRLDHRPGRRRGSLDCGGVARPAAVLVVVNGVTDAAAGRCYRFRVKYSTRPCCKTSQLWATHIQLSLRRYGAVHVGSSLGSMYGLTCSRQTMSRKRDSSPSAAQASQPRRPHRKSSWRLRQRLRRDQSMTPSARSTPSGPHRLRVARNDWSSAHATLVVPLGSHVLHAHASLSLQKQVTLRDRASV